MAYAPHVKVSFGGTLHDTGAGPEIWNCTVAMLGPDAAQCGIYLAAIKAPLANWFHASESKCASSSTLDYAKANHIDPSGAYTLSGVTNQVDYSPPITGATAQTVPSILSVVTSWYTDVSRGPGSRGRIYLPNFTTPNPDSLILSPAFCTQVATAGKNLLIALSQSFGGAANAFPVVASNVDGSTHPITKIGVGNVIDVQRRRKDALKETYTVVAA